MRKYKDSDGGFLDVFDVRGGYVVAWSFAGDIGMELGEWRQRMPAESLVAFNAIHDFCEPRADVAAPRFGGYVFESESVARQALRHVNAALVAWQDGIEMPEWAKTAMAEGWNPPRGWKPKPKETT